MEGGGSKTRSQRRSGDSPEETGEPSFGLRVAQATNPSTFYALGITALASNNIDEATRILRRYPALISDGLSFDIKIGDTWDLVLAVGINSREQDPTKTTGPYIRNMVSAANRKFPNAHIHLTEVAYHQKVPLISARNRYTPVERINYLPHLNHWIPNWITRASHHYRGKLHWIPLPTFPLYFQHDNIHLTTRSATDLVHHWMSTLRSNY